MRYNTLMSIFLKPSIILFPKNYSKQINKCTKFLKHRGPPWKILFFGTDEFSLYSLKALCSKLRTGTLIETLGIVTKSGSVVEKFGLSENLPKYEWPLKAADVKNTYDIGMVVSFGKMIPEDIIESFPLGCINVHASMLPKWRGAAPIIHAIMNGDTETGITIMRIHPEKFDIGEIVRQYRISIENNETTVQLENKLAKCGSDVLMECIRDLPRCIEMAVPQPNEGIKYAPKIRSEMSTICWRKMSSRSIYNLYRALNHLYPITTKWHGSVVKFTEVILKEGNISFKSRDEKQTIITDNLNKKSALAFLNSTEDNKYELELSEKCKSEAGSVEFLKNKKELIVKCCDGNNLVVKKLKISGKTISAIDFYNGFLIKRPKIEWIFGT